MNAEDPSSTTRDDTDLPTRMTLGNLITRGTGTTEGEAMTIVTAEVPTTVGLRTTRTRLAAVVTVDLGLESWCIG